MHTLQFVVCLHFCPKTAPAGKCTHAKTKYITKNTFLHKKAPAACTPAKLKCVKQIILFQNPCIFSKNPCKNLCIYVLERANARDVSAAGPFLLPSRVPRPKSEATSGPMFRLLAPERLIVKRQAIASRSLYQYS